MKSGRTVARMVFAGMVAFLLAGFVGEQRIDRLAPSPSVPSASRILIGLNADAPDALAAVEREARAYGYHLAGAAESIGLAILAPRGERDANAFVHRLASLPVVRYAEREGGARACGTPGDPRFGPEQDAFRRIHLPEAWDVQTGSADTLVAVVDTGIDATHEDLAGAVAAGVSFVDESPGDASDNNGHGTGVAGIIGARGDNGIGIAGISWRTRLLAVKVADHRGMARYGDLALGIVWAADHGAQIINVSIAGRRYSRALADAVEYALERGALVVGATGTAGSHAPGFPASLPGVLSVAGITADERPDIECDFNSATPVGAPSDGIVSTFPGNDYSTMRGSSGAAAIVSGVAALLLAQNPALDRRALARILRASQRPLPFAGWSEVYEMGEIDAASAVRRARADFRDVALARAVLFPRRPVAGREFEVRAEIRNAGNRALREVKVEALLDGRRVAEKEIEDLPPGKSKTAKLEAQAPGSVGPHDLVVRLSAEGDEAAENDEATPTWK